MTRRKKKTSQELFALTDDQIYTFLKAYLARESSTHRDPEDVKVMYKDGVISVQRDYAEFALRDEDIRMDLYLEILRLEVEKEKDAEGSGHSEG